MSNLNPPQPACQRKIAVHRLGQLAAIAIFAAFAALWCGPDFVSGSLARGAGSPDLASDASDGPPGADVIVSGPGGNGAEAILTGLRTPADPGGAHQVRSAPTRGPQFVAPSQRPAADRAEDALHVVLQI